MPPPVDHTGKRFGRFTVQARASFDKETAWHCLCDCGTEKVVRTASLTKGLTLSCGCYHRDKVKARNRRHGYAGSRLYGIWRGMRQRCSNQNDDRWKDYGGRGITVCAEWDSNFVAFKDWSEANGYDDNLSIDRINNDGNYAPDNCRWANLSEQRRNMRPQQKGEKLTREQAAEIKRIISAGGPRGFQKDIAERYGVHRNTVYDIAHGRIWASA